MQKIFEKLRIEILKTLDDQNTRATLNLQNSLNKSAKNPTNLPTEKGRIF